MRNVSEADQGIGRSIGEVATGAKQNDLIVDEVGDHIANVSAISEKPKELSVQLDC